jgi:hypothetical protein
MKGVWEEEESQPMTYSMRKCLTLFTPRKQMAGTDKDWGSKFHNFTGKTTLTG